MAGNWTREARQGPRQERREIWRAPQGTLYPGSKTLHLLLPLHRPPPPGPPQRLSPTSSVVPGRAPSRKPSRTPSWRVAVPSLCI